MSFLTGIALRRRSVTLLLVLLVFLLGVFTWSSIPAELFPQIEATTIQVVTFLPGSNPDAMVEDVSEPIEDAITGIKGLDNSESTSFASRSVVLANFVDGTDMEAAEGDVVVTKCRPPAKKHRNFIKDFAKLGDLKQADVLG